MKLFKTRSILAGINRDAKDNGEEEKQQRKRRKNGTFCGQSRREERKRRERVRARRANVGEKARRGEILDTPKLVASPSVNSTCWRELLIKAELSTRGSVSLKGMKVSVNRRPECREI